MSLLITNSTISKLTHGLPDIRQRALREVASKVKEGSRNKDEFVCSSVDLYKELVKAINDTKLSQSEYVEVLLDLFKSHYGTSLVKIIGIPQIKRDTQNAFRKIYSGNLKLRTPIDEFSRFLKKFEVEDVLPQIFSEKVSLNPQPNFKLDFPDEDYVNRWSKPPQKDYHEMESLKMSLVDYQNVLGMEHALTFLHKSVKNLPAEYFLQPPYLYKNLLDCLQIENYEKSSLTVLLDLTKALQARMKVRTLTRTCEIFVDDAIDEAEMRSQLSVKAFCRHLMAAAMRALKEMDDHECQERLNVFFELMSAVVNVMKSCKAECSAVLCDMTEFLQYYRAQYQSEKGNFRCRVNYFAMLQMIATLASTKMNEDYGDELQVWQKELETSLMDFSFREMMPDVYEHIYELCNGEKNVRLTNMVHAAEILSPAVDLLRSPNKFNDEELILNGLSMLETLKILKSEGLVRKLMTAILNCTPNFQNDPNLRKHGEHLFLRLLATSVPRLKSIAYQLATDAVKNFFAQVVDGVMLKRYEVHDERGARFMGIPLNTEILGEIISFGLKNNNEVIRRGAEIIITYIVKGKTVLGKHWMKFLQVLMPLLPLLQSIEPVSSLLGHGITSLFDPDFDLPPLECMHGNMRYLFSNESQAREDACLRLIYMTSSQLNSANYLPKIDHVKSTLTNTFCILRNRMPLRNPLKMGVFDVQSMRELVEVLKSQEASPKVRYSTLIQLNAFMDDPTLCDVLHQQKGWPYVLQAFDNAMKLDDNRDFPDSAIPALQIICKLCIHSPERRRDFSQDIDFNMLLMRAMFMHYHDKDFRSDAATLIFLMAFCDFIVGEDELSVPKALSELFIPFQCEYHDVTSPYDKTSDLEMMFLAEMDDEEQPYDDILFVIDEKTSPKRTKKTTFAPIGSSDEPWQYLRMTFTSLWFGGSEFVLQNVNESEGFRGVVNYKRFPKGLSGSEILDFDPKLEVLEADINLMKITSLPEMIKHQISLIDQAASHEKASKNVACLKSVIFLPHYEEHLPKDLMKVLKRFVVVQPKTDDDEHLFKLVLDLLSHLIKIGYDTILKWALTTLNDHNSTFIRLLHDKRQSLGLFHANIAFVETCIRFFCLTGDAEIQKLLQTDSQGGLVLHIFEIMSEELIKCDKNRVQAQLSLMKTISEFAELETDETFLNKVIGQLFYCLKSLNSLTFSGSYIAKNCLFTIGNVMKLIQQPNLDPNLIKLLQAYCGHKDFVVRAAAWSIFAEICTSQSGAKQVIYELADHLPGGLHACIIQTLLDVEEVSLVKGTAATLFVNLLSFKNERGLVQDVWPRCTKKPIDPKKFDGFELLVQLLNKQRFLELVREQLDRFAPNIYINPEEKIEILTFPDTVIHLANILIAVSDVRPICALTEGEKLTLEAFLRCTYPIVPRNIGSTTLAMVTSVCNLLARYLTHDKKLLDIFVHNSWFVGSMLRLLDLAFYDQEEICTRTCTNILHLMQILAQYPVGYELICVSLEQMKPEIIMHFINYNMTGVEKPTLLIDVMNCLTVLTTKHVNNSSSFSSLLDTTSIEDPLSQPSNDGNPVIGLASEVLTKRLIYIFDVVCEQDKPKSGVFHMSELKIATYNCLQALLRYTENAGTIAVDCLLFEKILNRLNTIALDVGMTMRDFIHKYGDRKKKPILQELGLIAGLLSNWYCRVSMLDDMQAEQLLKSLMNVWEWTADGELLLKMMTALMVLSEKSFVVCRGLAVYQSFNHPAFVKRVADIAKNETRKVKGASNLLGVLRVAIRVLINCCSCVEGRIQLHKINVLEIFEHFQPPLMKKNKTMRQMAPLWLEFYEIFSRYLEGSTARHLYLLCTFARKQDANVRIPAMKILRNMAFNLGNRSNLLTSKDYQFLVREKLDSGDIEERIMIISSLWKLVANQWKHKNELKNSAVYIKLNNLSKTLADKFETESDLYKILTCLLDILSS